MKRAAAAAAALAGLTAWPIAASGALPPGFVYLSDVVPSAVQDVRYAGDRNILGRPLAGYRAAVCILTVSAARALQRVQSELESAGLTLRVYDCYRPRSAADDLLAWVRHPSQRMKGEYYPRVDKAQLARLGYLDGSAAHERGSAVDVTLQRLPVAAPAPWKPGTYSCIAPFLARYHDGSIDMGTTYDCMDPLSRQDAQAGNLADAHRALLRSVMKKYGFSQPHDAAWWHFVLREEPFAHRTFDFPVTEK